MAGNKPMDGSVIRRLGIQSYLDNRDSQSTSNIDFFADKQKIMQNWQQCNFGCHHPGYRVLNREATYADMMQLLDSVHLSVAGFVDGNYQTFKRVGLGTKRVAQSYGASGLDRIAEIGEENSLAFNLAKNIIMKLFTMDISLVDNPLTEMVIKIIESYTSALPDSVVIPIIEQGKLKFEEIDADWVRIAIKKGLTNIDTTEGVETAIDILKQNKAVIQKMAGKWAGKKVATYIATVIAVEIARRVAMAITRSTQYRNFLRYRPVDKTTKGLAGVVISLLKAHGMLQIASEASMRLQSKCPLLWYQLRNKQGLDLLYWLIEDFVKEYVDRISLAEKNPTLFLQMVKALITPQGGAEDIFLPFQNAKTKPVTSG